MRSIHRFVLILAAGLSLEASAQAKVTDGDADLDSLYSIWLDDKRSDSLRAVAFEAYIYFGFVSTDPDSAIRMADGLIKFGSDRNYPTATSFGHELIGFSHYEQDHYSEALKHFTMALDVAEGAGIAKYRADLMNTIGVMYGTLGNEVRALEFYEKALKAAERVGDLEIMEMCVSNIGEVYLDIENDARALEYLERGLQLEEEMGDSIGIALSLDLIAGVYREQGELEEALSYSKQALRIHERFGHKEGIAYCHYSLGTTYKEQQEYGLALQHLNQGLVFNAGRDPSEFHAKTLIKIGGIYRELGEDQQAQSNCLQGLELANKMGLLMAQRDACECLYQTYRTLNDGDLSLVYLERMRSIEDSLNTQAANNRLQQMEIEKQALADSLEFAKKEELKDQEIEKRDANLAKQRIGLAATGGILFLLALLAISIRRGKKRSDELLHNILPEEVAAELKQKGRSEARLFEETTVLFTDFKGFTAISEQLGPSELVQEIDTCFKAFDAIMEKYGIEKIKTIGDAYMAAGGLHVPRTSEPKDVVLAGLEMQSWMKVHKAERDAQGLPSFEMRVGIHTGPVVAGIVGVKKFQYDIWGDTVNTASRMESSGEVGQVNISEATYGLVKDVSSFSFTPRGKVAAKGKGEMEMYFVQH